MSRRFRIEPPAPLRTTAWKRRGVHIGIVADNKDGDGNPGYRVKLVFPALSDTDQSTWARILVPMAGNDRGTYFLPEIDDQVLVVFEHGDINRPIVIGALWSKAQPWPEVNESGNNHTKLIKSRNSHRVIFDDKDGDEKIIIVDNSKKNLISMESGKNLIRIECDGDIDIKASDNVVIFANTFKHTTKDKTQISAGSQLLVSSGGKLDVVSSGKLNLVGASVKVNTGKGPSAQVAGAGSGQIGAAGKEQPKDQVTEHVRAGADGDGAAALRPPRVLRRLTRVDGEAPVGTPSPSNALLGFPDDAVTKDPLVTAVAWQDAELAWGTPRVLTAPRKQGGAKPAVTVTAIARNVGASVAVKIVDADSGATVASGKADVVNDAVAWTFVPADAGLERCAEVRAIVEGGGKTAETADTLHVHQPYWDDARTNRLRYGVTWPAGEKFPERGSTHWWETIDAITADDVGRTNLDAWAGRLTLYMRKHLGLDAASPTIDAPRCRFDVRDLQADLGVVGSLYDTEGTLTGGTFAASDAPSGVFGPLTFLGLFLVQRLAMYPDGDNAGASRGGQPATLGADEQLALVSAARKPRPTEVGPEIAKLVQAWVVGGLTARVEGPDLEQARFRYHGGSPTHVQRRIARRYQMWIHAVELLGGWMPIAGPRRDWGKAIWQKYANGRSAVSNHLPGLAMDFQTHEAGEVPYTAFLVVKDAIEPDRFELWQNLAVARSRKGQAAYPAQPADHLSADDRDAVKIDVGRARYNSDRPRDELRVYLRPSAFRGVMTRHAKEVARAIAVQTTAAKAAKAKVDKALKATFKGLTKDEQLAKLQALASGTGPADALALYERQKANLQAFLIASARIRVLAVEHRRFAILAELATAGDARRAALVAELRASIADLEQQSHGVHLHAPPFELTTGRATKAISSTTALPIDELPQIAERAVLGSELSARKTVLAAVEAAVVDDDAIVLAIKGEFIRLDQIAEETCQLYRVKRHPNEWEWWHYQFFDPDTPDPQLKSDALIVEMARELGLGKVPAMLHHTEVEGVAGSVDKLGPDGLATLAARYQWWRDKHPTEFELATKTHHTGLTLAELTKPTA